jgi:5-methylcytosine-specific restriction protein A
LHQKVHDRVRDEHRENASRRGYGSKWQKARAGYLRRNPLCVECLQGNMTVPATIVDHVIPHRGDYGLFWDRANWQSLCKFHHDRKTVIQDGGLARKA